ncbi:hypothetical protein I2486_17600 [Cellulophaga sp. E16_2]|uniref:DUF2383 domain-containing protein n=1 Tax=Cellulophaga algicola (strain DSM 14237 / IC166 / ACAM 630) TaxID=688270 RepID=E6X8H1_CELAD|nr:MULTISPECIES: hypothetical protein [Cellulophaga]ADV50827.1 hypothetical protein Celal_3565 [Cellulophaga algicola DSM 14237]MBO0593222.1 hypothetical protein [Cellulophaga sp. E16_2]
MNQEINDALNEITEIHLSLKEIYQKLSEESNTALKDTYEKKKNHFEELYKEMIQLIYNLGGKYIECKNPTEQELQDLIAMISTNKGAISNEKIEGKIETFKDVARQKYEVVLKAHNFSEDEEEVLKNHLRKL